MSENTGDARRADTPVERRCRVPLAPPAPRRIVDRVPIPFDKPYRAFRELDALSDRQCRRLVALAARRHRVSRAFAVIGSLAATAGGWALVAGAWRLLAAGLPEWEASLEQRDMGPAMWMILMAACVAVGPVCGLYVRNRWLRWAIRDCIDRMRCEGCGRPLLGPGATGDGPPDCPACGATTTARTPGISAGTLVAPG